MIFNISKRELRLRKNGVENLLIMKENVFLNNIANLTLIVSDERF
jgi:hypothetical protein